MKNLLIKISQFFKSLFIKRKKKQEESTTGHINDAAAYYSLGKNFTPPTKEQEQEALAQMVVRELTMDKQRKSMRIVVKPPTFIDKYKAGRKNFYKNLSKN